ncbi:MAG: general secretion pathway protein GspB [Proteobacteria bacterium]|nr:general secretion pathway protein GspB [Pseudomonadota bacterium]MBU1058023.1 general secretion pathway protein GspB [Pseudomonadota bacterium]
MSYILEALKKSEKERKKEGVPDLQADHSLPPAHRPERVSLVAKWLAGAVAFLLLGGGVWFWWTGEEKDLPQLAQELEVFSPSPPPLSPGTSQAVVPLTPASDSGDLSQEILVQISQEVRQAMAEVRGQNQPPSSAVLPDVEPESPQKIDLEISEPQPVVEDNPENVLPLLEEMPTELREKIPELSFAGHVYADDPGKRLIMINNRILREGDQVSKSLSLQQITRAGVILRYEVFVFQVKLF